MEQFIQDNQLGIAIVLVVIFLVLLLTLTNETTDRKSVYKRQDKLNRRKGCKAYYEYFSQQGRQTSPHIEQTRTREEDSSYNIAPKIDDREQNKIDTKDCDLKEDIMGNDVLEQQIQEQKTITYQYLQEANGGKFLKAFTSPNKCFFRTWEDNGVRKFEFCGNVAKALANINAIFDDVCDIEGKRNGAREIENISAGILNSELVITTKATIRLK